MNLYRKMNLYSPAMKKTWHTLRKATVLADNLELHWNLGYHRLQYLRSVAEGIDGASRSGADFGKEVYVHSILGPAVSDELWSLVSRAAVEAGWGGVTVDAFASESNSLLEPVP